MRTISRKDGQLSAWVASVPDSIGYFLAGFTDGEGSFNFSFRRRPDYRMPWKVSVSFNVSQKDREILTLFQRYLSCGSLRPRSDGIWYYEVTALVDVTERVIPFFERFNFQSAKKQRDFAKFKSIVALMQVGAHLSESGIREILAIRVEMNNGGNRRYSDQQIIAQLVESSETTRRASRESRATMI
jgi:hypothetical protein